MKQIKSFEGKTILVDDDKFEKLNSYSWYIDSRGHVVSKPIDSWDINEKGQILHTHINKIFMEDEVTSTKYRSKKMQLTHINKNNLDNRRQNLTLISTSTKNHKTKHILLSTNTSGYRGVSFMKDKNKYRAEIQINGKSIRLGHFINKVDAAQAYNEMAFKYLGKNANLNKL